MTGAVIQVVYDFDGLKTAALEVLEECLVTRRRASGDLPERTLSEGYYVRVAYLMELEEMTEDGVRFRTDELDPSELLGLRALRAARNEHERNHPPCPECGAALGDRFALSCSECSWTRPRRK